MPRSQDLPAEDKASRRRVMLVAPARVGGTIQYTHNLANALAEAGHQVTLATAIGYELRDFPRRYELIEVFDRFRPRPGPIRDFLRSARRLRPEIVHLQGAQRPEFYLLTWAVLKALAPARFVWTPQDVLSNSLQPYHRGLLRVIYARMSHVFLNARQNEAAVTGMFGVPRERITVLAIPDLLTFAREDLAAVPPPELSCDASAPLLLCFGLIEERKGIGTLIEAFLRYRAQGGQASLLVMGKALTDTAPYRAALADGALPLGAAQILDRYASFEEMNALFRRAVALILPYHSGWNSGVLASAQGYGKPVIATTVGGFDEVVTDGRTGLLVPAADAAALAQAMARLAGDPALAARMGQAALAQAGQVSWQAVAATTGAVYDLICAESVERAA